MGGGLEKVDFRCWEGDRGGKRNSRCLWGGFGGGYVRILFMVGGNFGCFSLGIY